MQYRELVAASDLQRAVAEHGTRQTRTPSEYEGSVTRVVTCQSEQTRLMQVRGTWTTPRHKDVRREWMNRSTYP